jgi:hypothetical protein
VRNWAEEVKEAGVGHMLETFDPERKERRNLDSNQKN